MPAEFNPYYKKRALAAARMGDAVNPKKESSGHNFISLKVKYMITILLIFLQKGWERIKSAQKKAYTTVGGTPHLDANYTVFGELVEGLDIISKISNVTRDKTIYPRIK